MGWPPFINPPALISPSSSQHFFFALQHCQRVEFFTIGFHEVKGIRLSLHGSTDAHTIPEFPRSQVYQSLLSGESPLFLRRFPRALSPKPAGAKLNLALPNPNLA
jgi:hypothetical protein